MTCGIHKKKEKCRVRITEKCLEEILRELFGSIIREYEAKGNGLQQLFDQEEKKVIQVQEREIKKMEQRIAKSETVMAELYEDYVLGNISKELFPEQKKTIGVTSEDDQKKLQELLDKKNTFQQRNTEKLKWLLTMEAVTEMELDKELIQFLVKRIEVYSGHRLKVFYPFEEHELKEE